MSQTAFPPYVQKIIAERDAALKDAADWNREWEMYSRAWLRELGGKLFPKSHRIDALVITTAWFRANQERWVREVNLVKQLRSDLAAARTIGLPLEPIFDAFIKEDEAGRTETAT